MPSIVWSTSSWRERLAAVDSEEPPWMRPAALGLDDDELVPILRARRTTDATIGKKNNAEAMGNLVDAGIELPRPFVNLLVGRQASYIEPLIF